MSPLDFGIVGAYLVSLLVCGALLARKAGQGAESYFLGDREMPWWALGASGMASNLDAAGTMTIVTMLYLYGVHGFFIEMRGGVVLPIAVFMAFMGKWHQRSQVITTAEWMKLRFGEGIGGRAARAVAALTYLVITVGMVVFFLAAAGKFLTVFLPFSPTACSIGMAAIALAYTLLSGLYGVVWTDVFQGFLILGAAVYIAARAAMLVDPALIEAWEGARFNTLLPRSGAEGPAGYELFLAFLLAWAAKGLLEGLGGSGGSAYMAQRYYAARSPQECQKIGMLWTVLFATRWPMALGVAVMGAHLGIGGEDPESLLPQVLASEFFPSGMRGIVVAALLAASMSTFDSTINAGASYVVRDLYLPWRPQATQRQQVFAGYAASAGIVALGLALAFFAGDSVVNIWVLIVIQLFPAFLMPFALRWFWGRFNGEGFSLGVAFGFAGSLAVATLDALAGWNEAQALLGIASFSLVGCLLGTYLFPAVEPMVLERFYKRIRPNGLWPRAWKQPNRAELRGNWLRLGSGIVWQVTTFMLPMFALLQQWRDFWILAVVWTAALGALLYWREKDEGGVGSD